MQRHIPTLIALLVAVFIIGGAYILKVDPASTEPLRTHDAIVYGAENAPTRIVVFSDFECPFCSRLHPTVIRLVDESDGAVSLEFRHLPLPSHTNAETASYAAECVFELAGTAAFWTFADALFTHQQKLNSDLYKSEAEKLGVASNHLESCMNSADIKERVSNDVAEGRELGANGTPYSIIVFSDGTERPVSGALPYETWTSLLVQ